MTDEKEYPSLSSGKVNIFKASATTGVNPWTADDVDKFGTKDVTKEYREIIKATRFFYRRDPMASITINKFVDIAITKLKIVQGNLSDNQFRVYESFLDDLQEFLEGCALEFLITGLVIPEVDFEAKTKKQLEAGGIKSYKTLELPQAMWIRDPTSIVINAPLIGSKPSYFLEVPDEVVYFITSGGYYRDGTKDIELFNEIKRLYPRFVTDVKNGEKKFLLINEHIIRRRYLPDSPYPTPYLYPALESLRHKRQLRRMDYSVASRVQSAIQLIKVGNDEYPLVGEDDNQLETLRSQMVWRDSYGRDVDRIFQLFTNHTVTIEWIFPEVSVLLDEKKYYNVNRDILNALGIPKILITGETERSSTSNADIALLSPIKTMEFLRRKLITIAEYVFSEIARRNTNLPKPEISFSAMNLKVFADFLEGLKSLYESGNMSRGTYADQIAGLNITEELEKRAEENKLIEQLELEEFAPVPHSNAPQNTSKDDENSNNEEDTGE